MTRGRWTWDNATQKLVPYVPERPRPTAQVITDDIPGGIRSMADSQTYTSKSKLRESYRRLGKTELGNDADYEVKPDPADIHRADERRRADLERAWYDVRDNNAELSEKDRARCRELNDRLDKL